MSLLNRLLAGLTLAIVVILAGTLTVGLSTARTYLNDDLQAQSRNAASALALLMSQPTNQDPAARELLMTALFDSGQFLKIRFAAPNGTTEFELKADEMTAESAVPSWFAILSTFDNAPVAREVSSGWKQLGLVEVQADDREARQALWVNALRLLIVVLGAGVLWGLFVVVVVRWFRRVLKTEIGAQLATLDSSRPQVSTAPGLQEFEVLRNEFGQARQRITATRAELDSRIESLELELNQDSVTGLANRKYFINELRRRVEQAQGKGRFQGHVLLFRQRDLAEINRALPRAQVDEWLHAIGERVKEAIAHYPDIPCQLARLNGSDFAVLIETGSSLDAVRLAQHIRKTLAQLQVTLRDGSTSRWAYALIDSGPHDHVSSLLSALDHALMRAESSGHKDIEYVVQNGGPANTPATAHSETQWSTLIERALAHDGLVLAYRSTRQQPDETPSRYEALLFLKDEGSLDSPIPGFLFMPVAQRLGLADQCDLKAVAMGIEWIRRNDLDLVIRVSMTSILSPRFASRLIDMVSAAGPVCIRHVLIELDAFSVVTSTAEVVAFCREMSDAGIRIGLRNLGQQPDALVHMHQMHLSYVKVGADFTAGLLSSPGSLNLLSAMVQTAQALKVQVLASEAPDQNTINVLTRQGVRWVIQGALQ